MSKSLTKIKATFIGKDGSMGFVNNKEYEISITHYVGVSAHGHVFIVTDTTNPDRSCPYKSFESILENWENIHLETLEP